MPRDWAFLAANAAVLEALGRRSHHVSLREHFGTKALDELARLARLVRRAPKPHERVLIVPGMMGSRLCDTVKTGGVKRTRVLWIDPKRIGAGRLDELVLPGGRPVRPSGVLLPPYAKLKLELALAGYDARFFAYDWRLGIEVIGAKLAAVIGAMRPAAVIAHSMGALAARIAVRLLPHRNVKRLILLGAPNRGSFAPVLALRGVYPFVQKLSRLDRAHSSEELAAGIFSTFPGLYQMLPTREHASLDFDLLDPRSWPGTGPQPEPALLARVASARAAMADPDERMVQIVGVNRPTIVGMHRAAESFEYTCSLNGDGTVPVSMALLPSLSTYYVEELHGSLTSNCAVIDAIVQLLRDGRTQQLARSYAPTAGIVGRLDDIRLRKAALGKIDWASLDSRRREAVMADLEGAEGSAPAGSSTSLA